VKLSKKIITMSALASLFSSTNSFALGECGFACCLAGAATSGVTLAQNFGLSVQYENMDMTTLRNGRSKISPDEAINRHWTLGNSYSISTHMKMEKLNFIGVLPMNERWQMLGMLPYIRNDMDMRNKGATGAITDMKMDTVEGIGDMSLMSLYTVHTDAPIRPTERLTLGIGVKTPTGKNNERNSKGTLIHAMMQTGSGSWDGLFSLNYMKAFYPLVLQGNLFYHLTTKGKEGYEFGDQIGYDLSARYQVGNYVNIGLEINGIHAFKDKDHDGKFTRLTSMPDTPDYTGLDSILLSPLMQFKIPNSNGSVDFKYQRPMYQKVNGYQQVVDSRWQLSVTWGF